MKILKDESAQVMGNVIQLVLVIVLVGIIGLVGIYIDEKISDKTALVDSTAATGTITFTANTNVSNGELVNFTDGSTVVRYEFNTTGNPQTNSVLTANAVRVNASCVGTDDWCKGWRVSGNLTTAINANTSIAITATNASNSVTLAADNTGTGANSITIADNSANITVSGMSGATDRDTFYNASSDAVDSVETGFDFIEILILAIVAGLVILAIFSYIPIKL